MARMLYFDAVQAGRHQRLEPVSTSAIAWMRPDGERSSFVRDPDCVLDGQPRLGHERAPVGTEVSHESVAKIANKPTRDQGSRHVRPSEGPAVGLLKYFFESHWHA